MAETIETKTDIRELSAEDLEAVAGASFSKFLIGLQEANNIYTRASKAMSDISSKWSQTQDGIAQNFK